MSFTEDDLRAVLTDRSDTAVPRSDLAARARRDGRTRRGGRVAAVTAAAALAAVAGARVVSHDAPAPVPAATAPALPTEPVTLLATRSPLDHTPRIAAAQVMLATTTRLAISFTPRGPRVTVEVNCHGPSGSWYLVVGGDGHNFMYGECTGTDRGDLGFDPSGGMPRSTIVGKPIILQGAVLSARVPKPTGMTSIAQATRLIRSAAAMPSASGSWALGVYGKGGDSPSSRVSIGVPTPPR